MGVILFTPHLLGRDFLKTGEDMTLKCVTLLRMSSVYTQSPGLQAVTAGSKEILKENPKMP